MARPVPRSLALLCALSVLAWTAAACAQPGTPPDPLAPKTGAPAAKSDPAAGKGADAKSPDGKTGVANKDGAQAAQGDAAGKDGKSDGKTEGKADGAAGDGEEKPSVPAKSEWSKVLESGAMGLMIRGGWCMWPILALGIVAMAVMMERWRSLKMLGTDSGAVRTRVLELLRSDRIEEALGLCDRSQGPVPAILSTGLRKFFVLRRLGYDAGRIEEQVVKAMDDYSVHVVAALERHLPILATVSSAAPMVGFLGTVVGMVESFDAIVAQRAAGGSDIIGASAAGIAVALLTTAFGLIVGLPAFIAYNYFTSEINRFVLDVEESATELIEVVTLQQAIGLEPGTPAANGAPESASPAHAAAAT
jgi:biopolymer transport protein ExbB